MPVLRRYTAWRTLVVPLLLALLVAACPAGDDGAADRDGPTIVVASFDFPESVLLAEIFAQALEADGYDVETALSLGTREAIFPSLEAGDIGLMPEYIGSALSVGFGGEPTSDVDETTERVREEFAAIGITVLDPAPGENTNVYAVTAEFADEHDLTTISDLDRVGRTIVLGAGAECADRMTCLRGLREVYDLDIEMETLQEMAPRIASLEQRRIDLAAFFSTMPIIAEAGFVVLEDDREITPAENIVAAVNDDILDAYGDELRSLLNAITAALTTEELMALNHEVEIDGRDERDVARDWLEVNGFLGS